MCVCTSWSAGNSRYELGREEEEIKSQGNEAALGLGSGLLTFLYLPAKVVYATLGGIVGGFTYGLDWREI